jgi:hypothetical protein
VPKNPDIHFWFSMTWRASGPFSLQTLTHLFTSFHAMVASVWRANDILSKTSTLFLPRFDCHHSKNEIQRSIKWQIALRYHPRLWFMRLNRFDTRLTYSKTKLYSTVGVLCSLFVSHFKNTTTGIGSYS